MSVAWREVGPGVASRSFPPSRVRPGRYVPGPGVAGCRISEATSGAAKGVAGLVLMRLPPRGSSLPDGKTTMGA